MPRKPHAAWQFFEVVVPGRVKGKPNPDVRCLLCGRVLRNARVSVVLLPHVAACERAPERAKQLLQLDAQRVVVRVLSRKERALYAELAEGLATDGTALTVVDSLRFKKLFKYLYPALRAPRAIDLDATPRIKNQGASQC